jgi:rhodanese-related sulfurtransferase
MTFHPAVPPRQVFPMVPAQLLPFLLLLACGGHEDVSLPGPVGVTTVGDRSQDPEAGRPAKPSEESFVVDLRAPADFARGHLTGSVNLQWGWGQFELRVARLFPAGARLEIVGAEPGRIDRAVAIARARGYRADGEVVDFERLPAERVSRLAGLTARDLHRRRDDFLILDVRTADEYADGHVRTALFLYPDDIRKIAPALRKDHRVAVVCEGGWRSSLVASWLRRAGFEKVFDVPGGMAEWRAEGLPIEAAADQHGFR